MGQMLSVNWYKGSTTAGKHLPKLSRLKAAGDHCACEGNTLEHIQSSATFRTLTLLPADARTYCSKYGDTARIIPFNPVWLTKLSDQLSLSAILCSSWPTASWTADSPMTIDVHELDDDGSWSPARGAFPTPSTEPEQPLFLASANFDCMRKISNRPFELHRAITSFNLRSSELMNNELRTYTTDD